MFAAFGLVLLAIVAGGTVAVCLCVRWFNAWAHAMIVSFGLAGLYDHPELLYGDRDREKASSSRSHQ